MKIMREHHFTEFVIRINDNKWMGITTHVRLAQAQQRIGLSSSIIIAEPNSLINWDMDRNLNFSVLKEMKLQLYSFNASRLNDTWMDTYQATSLNQIFEDIVLSCDEKQSAKLRKSFLLRSQKTLIFTSLLQLLTPDNKLLSWPNLKLLHNLPAQGHVPIWFKSLEHSIFFSDQSTLIRISVAPLLSPIMLNVNDSPNLY